MIIIVFVGAVYLQEVFCGQAQFYDEFKLTSAIQPGNFVWDSSACMGGWEWSVKYVRSTLWCGFIDVSLEIFTLQGAGKTPSHDWLSELQGQIFPLKNDESTERFVLKKEIIPIMYLGEAQTRGYQMLPVLREGLPFHLIQTSQSSLAYDSTKLQISWKVHLCLFKSAKMSEWWVSQKRTRHDHQSRSPQPILRFRPEISAASASSLPSWPAINPKEMLHLTRKDVYTFLFIHWFMWVPCKLTRHFTRVFTPPFSESRCRMQLRFNIRIDWWFSFTHWSLMLHNQLYIS